MDASRYSHSIQVGLSFGLVSGVITSLGLVVGLAFGTGSRLAVIGGGPGGLEAARVSARRGHEVVLMEAAATLGGQLVLAAKATWRRDLSGIASWLAGEIERFRSEWDAIYLGADCDVVD